MDVTGKEIRLTRRLTFEQGHADGFVFIEYCDQTGNEQKKRLIEDLIDKTLDEAMKIIGSE